MEFEKCKPIQRNGKGKSEVFFPKDFVVVDLETTGFSSEYDSIIEIAAIKVIDGMAVDKFQTLVNPECEIDEYITELNIGERRQRLMIQFFSQLFQPTVGEGAKFGIVFECHLGGSDRVIYRRHNNNAERIRHL